jgi:hypothetical protein
MINIKQIENIQKIIGDREQARAIADLLKNKVAKVYHEYSIKSEDFQKFIENRGEFVVFKQDGTLTRFEVDGYGHTDCEEEQLAQLQAYFMEMEM